jgi:hypothetical protein
MPEDTAEKPTSLTLEDLNARIEKLTGQRSILRDSRDAARAQVQELELSFVGVEHRIAELISLRDTLQKPEDSDEVVPSDTGKVRGEEDEGHQEEEHKEEGPEAVA